MPRRRILTEPNEPQGLGWGMPKISIDGLPQQPNPDVTTQPPQGVPGAVAPIHPLTRTLTSYDLLQIEVRLVALEAGGSVDLSGINSQLAALDARVAALEATLNAIGSLGAGGFTFRGTVATSTDLPPQPQPNGDNYLASDTGHLWISDGTTWIDAGPPMSASAFDNAVRAYLIKVFGSIDPGAEPPPMP